MNYKVKFLSDGVDIDGRMYRMNNYYTLSECLYEIYDDFQDMDVKLFVVIEQHFKEIIKDE